MCSRCAGTRPGPGPVDFGPDQTCRHTDKTLFLVVPAHFASPDLPAHCAGTRYTRGPAGGKDENNHRAGRAHRSIYLLLLAAGRSMS